MAGGGPVHEHGEGQAVVEGDGGRLSPVYGGPHRAQVHLTPRPARRHHAWQARVHRNKRIHAGVLKQVTVCDERLFIFVFTLQQDEK